MPTWRPRREFKKLKKVLQGFYEAEGEAGARAAASLESLDGVGRAERNIKYAFFFRILTFPPISKFEFELPKRRECRRELLGDMVRERAAAAFARPTNVLEDGTALPEWLVAGGDKVRERERVWNVIEKSERVCGIERQSF